jgi:hypothetical protein
MVQSGGEGKQNKHTDTITKVLNAFKEGKVAQLRSRRNDAGDEN